ncbi:MAG: serine/threonine protein kinase [Nannocystales bacterium]
MNLPGEPSGTRLGKYQLLRRIATGGMAEIFLARAQAMHGFEKQVVLKRILPQHASSDDFIRMFLAEARLAATLHHPNIVQVYDIGEEAGAYFFTMEYIQGEDLRRLVRAARRKQTPIPLAHILHIIMGMAGGLHHAHEKIGTDGLPLGIVHRDVSPSNVLVTYEGDVKVVDFGIAKAAAAQNSTIAGTLKGKIPYMSPEQCRGELVDRRSDIFSIGTLLWELTTGKRLFAGENEFAILNRVAKADVPPPSSVRPEYPPELEAIVMRALSVDPENRYPTAIDLQIDLEDFAREARLPVSSARMGRFMRALFDEELKAAAAERISAPASTDVPGGTMIVSPSSPPEGISDLTPSEVRLHGEPTPGLVPGVGGSGTDISIVEAPPKRRNPAVALGAGFLLTLGLGGGAYMAFGGDDQANAASVSASEGTPQREIEAVPVEPDPSELAGSDPAPTAVDEVPAQALGDAPTLAPGSAPEGDPSAPSGDAGTERPDPAAEAKPVPSAPVASAAKEPARSERTKPRRTPRKSKRVAKPATDKPKDPAPEPAKKPRYDENSARLPGM